MRRRRRRMLTPIARRSLRRDDPLGWLYTHGHIDDAQFKAGRKMQKLYATASIAALDKIAKLEAALGRNGASLARDFLGFGHSVFRCATTRGVDPHDRRTTGFVGFR